MDESKLRYFVSVARHLSFSKAAQELHVVQSTVSRQISLLEEELDTQLFVRDTHQVRLTAAGERLFKSSFSYMQQFKYINENVMNLLKKEEHRLSVVIGHFEQPLLIKAGRLFQQFDPNLELQPVISYYHVHSQYVQSGTARLFLTISPCIDMMPGCLHTSLGRYKWKAVAQADSDFWQLPPEKQAVLWGQRIIKPSVEQLAPSYEYLQSLPLENRSFSIAGSMSSTVIHAQLGAIGLIPEYMETWIPPTLRMEQIFPEPLETEAVLILCPDGASNLERQFFEYIRDNFKP